MSTHLLIVDDDTEIRDLLGRFFEKHHYQVSLAADGEVLFDNLNKQTPDLIILDVMLPGEDGISLCRKLRQQSNIPIIMLTAAGEEVDRIVGLEVGADDYVAKPFNPRELMARVNAVLRRSQDKPTEQKTTQFYDEIVSFNQWRLNLTTRELFSPENLETSLTTGEFDLLKIFVEHTRRVLSRDQLLSYTRNREAGPFDRTIDVQVSRLRQKIEEDPRNPNMIKTVRGGGYMFTAEVKNSA
jgi:two-component system OmpR family response regulator